MDAEKELTPKEEIEVEYTCPCGEPHETMAQARECCSHWICTECWEDHDTKGEANRCCKG